LGGVGEKEDRGCAHSIDDGGHGMSGQGGKYLADMWEREELEGWGCKQVRSRIEKPLEGSQVNELILERRSIIAMEQKVKSSKT